MTVREIAKELGLDIVAGEKGIDREVTSGFVGDLLSVVMAKANEGCAWITIQSHINIIAVATLVDMACVIISEGYDLDLDAKEKADEEGIAVLQGKDSSYELAKKLVKLDI